MYSFTPLAAIPADHGGMFIICMFVFGWLVIAFFHLDEVSEWTMTLITMTLILLFTYCVSFVWTDQEPKTFPNVQVTGEFVGFVAEGYNETRHSGKSTTHVDVHETYVVYSVNGQRVMLRSSVGQTYPQSVILYKN